MNKQVGGCLRTNELPWHACWEQMKSHFFQKREDFTALPCNYPIKGPRLYPCDPTKWRLRHTRWSWWWWDNLTPQTIWHLGQFDTIMQNRTIWHRPCREDNLTPRTIWHRGQFDTIINFIFLQLFGPQIWLEIYWLPLSIFLTENYPV